MSAENREVLYYDKIHEVRWNELAITSRLDQKPILATYGMLPCVSLAGIDRLKGIAFLGHYTTMTNPEVAIEMLTRRLQKSLDGEQGNFSVRIAGGIMGMSDYLVDTLREKLQSGRNGVIFLIEGEDVLGEIPRTRALGINAISGRFFDYYDPTMNPDHKSWLEVNLSDFPRLVYSPFSTK
jgi:hypothetical protein